MLKNTIFSFSFLFLVLFPSFAFASSQPATSTCSGTLVTTALSYNCTGFQAFPDDGLGNVPVSTNGSAPLQVQIQDTVGSPIISNNGALQFVTPRSFTVMKNELVSSSSAWISDYTIDLQGFISFFDASGILLGTSTPVQNFFGDTELVDFTGLPTTAIVMDASQFCPTLGMTLQSCGNMIGGHIAFLPLISSGSIQPMNMSSSTASLSDVTFGLSIIIVILFLMVCGMFYNVMKEKKPWR